MKLVIALVTIVSLSALVGCASQGQEHSSSNGARYQHTQATQSTQSTPFHQQETPATQASKMISPMM